LRGLWVATVDNIDWPTAPSVSPEEQQEELLTYLDLMVEMKMNCIFFQVRPVGDAFYESEIEPWSEFMTGEQGVAPDPLWDPLAFLVEHAHSRGIQVHAWINPYRAKVRTSLLLSCMPQKNSNKGLDPSHMAIRYSEYAYPYGSYLWMDPSAQVILDHILTVVDDILVRYEVDGLHIDDYFYPFPEGGLAFPDEATYAEYVSSGGTLSLEDWRRDNVNEMVQDLGNLVWSHDRIFSISPAGLYRPGHPEGMPPPIVGGDPYEDIFADSKLWLESGWMDWFIPQVYWAIAPPEQSFPEVLSWWLQVSADSAQKLVFGGTAIYKIEPPSDWDPQEIVDQIEISRQEDFRERFSMGNVHFSAKYFRDGTKNITEHFKGVYSKDAAIP
ncbi:hypothetical protein CAPTEDRAFT_138680, partial [Capitella teleta]